MDIRRYLKACTILVPPEASGVPRGEVLLTFDDGPNCHQGVTRQLRAILRERGLHACFCVIGRRAERYPKEVAALTADGHVLVNHGYSHQYCFGLTVPQLIEEIAAGGTAISEASGQPPPRWYRPPGGFVTAKLREAMEDAGVTLWPPVTGYARDATVGPDKAELVGQRLLAQVTRDHGGAIVLHDGCEAFDPHAAVVSEGVWGDRRWIPDVLTRFLEALPELGLSVANPHALIAAR